MSEIKADGGGLRFNEGKVRIDLIPTEWWLGLSLVMTRGADKYDVRNWERGMAWSTMIGCAFRHVLRFVCGARYDRDTGCHHLAMAAWNVLALMTYDLRQIGTNDMTGWSIEMDLLSKMLAVEPSEEFKAAVAKRRAARDGGPAKA